MLKNAMAINDDLEQLGVRLSDITVEPGSPLAGKAVSEIEVENNGGFLIVAIRHPDGSITRRPSGDVVANENDIIVLIGHGPNTAKLTLSKTPARETYRDMMG
jgi:K+/H+ antiporter YhaU regulatory subunit KhtT